MPERLCYNAPQPSTADRSFVAVSPLTVSALNTHIVALFERDDLLRDVAVVGEVSNWKRAASGHVYFSLKDSGAAIAAVMWRNSVLGHSWLPRDGDQIVAHGYVAVYPERGVYQLYANHIQPAGRGQLYAQFEALKAKLAAEGLFAHERKRLLPVSPQRIGIITSCDAAALRDILRVLAVRWPLVDVILFSVLVQGVEAPGQIVAALSTACRFSREIERLDLLILARGGGSIEDLWCFNDEQVAYALAASELPVVSGVGHETDFTIADFVADLRCPTPSAAAAAIVPDLREARANLDTLTEALTQSVTAAIVAHQSRLGEATRRLGRAHPQRLLDLRRQQLDDRERRLHWAIRRRVDRLRERQRGTARQLAALNPRQVLQRGYSIVARGDGAIVTGPARLHLGERLQVQAAQGRYAVTVSTATANAEDPALAPAHSDGLHEGE
jgi:exodeoxyribonuclease VII large subunit